MLVGLGFLDMTRFFLVADVAKPARLARAEKLNPYDALLQVQLSRSNIDAGNTDDGITAMRRAVALNPQNFATQNSLAQVLLGDQRYEQAFLQYQHMRNLGMMDVNALINYGMLASENRQYDEAVASFTQALKMDSNQLNARLYLAETLNKQGKTKASIVHYEKYLTLVGLRGGNAGLTPQQIAYVALKLADAYDVEKCPTCADRAADYRKKAEIFTALANQPGR